jgi:ribonuclease HI
MNVTIYIDVYHTGGLKKGTGTYCITLEYMKNREIPVTKQYIEGIKGTTKFRTAITACIAALEHMVKFCDISLVINSEHVTQAVNTNAWFAWINTGKNAKNKPAKNMDLWNKLFELVDKYPVTFTYAASNQYTDCMRSMMKHVEIEYKEDVDNV